MNYFRFLIATCWRGQPIILAWRQTAVEEVAGSNPGRTAKKGLNPRT